MRKRESPRRRLGIHYYDGAYGPTVRIETPTRFLVEQFMHVLATLAQRLERYVDLVESTNAETSDLAGIDLFLIEPGERSGFRRLKGPSSQARFAWSLTSEGWQSCLELVEPFVSSFEAGHAYLTNEGSDDALVELTYGE